MEFGELKVLVLNIKSNRTSKYVTNFFIIIRHYKCKCTVKLTEIDMIPTAYRASTQQHVPINNYSRYTLLSYTLIIMAFYCIVFEKYTRNYAHARLCRKRFEISHTETHKIFEFTVILNFGYLNLRNVCLFYNF